jgi:hypothetical protein
MENSVGEKFAQKNLGATQNKSCEVKIHLGPGNFDFFLLCFAKNASLSLDCAAPRSGVTFALYICPA